MQNQKIKEYKIPCSVDHDKSKKKYLIFFIIIKIEQYIIILTAMS